MRMAAMLLGLVALTLLPLWLGWQDGKLVLFQFFALLLGGGFIVWRFHRNVTQSLQQAMQQAMQQAGWEQDLAAQALGIAQVNQAVNDMDRVTQQNAALVEESAAATAMNANAGILGRTLAVFRLA